LVIEAAVKRRDHRIQQATDLVGYRNGGGELVSGEVAEFLREQELGVDLCG
jgi:hypothetical protein